MSTKWLQEANLTPNKRPILHPTEVETFNLSSTDIEPNTTTHPSLTTYTSGILTLTTHRLIWVPQSPSSSSSSSPSSAVSIPLSEITHIFPLKKSLKSVLSISSPRIRIQVSSPGSVGVMVVTLVMRGRGDDHDLFYEKLWEVWRGRAWESDEKAEAEGEAGGSGSVAIRVPVVGVSGILRKEQESWESTDKTLHDAFQDLNALMSKAREMVMLAEKMRQKLLQGPSSNSGNGSEEEMGSKEEMQDWMLSVGIISPVTKESAGALYHQQLSRQILSSFHWRELGE